MIRGSVSCPKINITSLSYPSCADLELTIANHDDGPLDSVNFSDPTRSTGAIFHLGSQAATTKVHPGISKPIAGLPPCHAEISNKFSAENKNSNKHQHATSQNTFLDVLLPAHQTSPVHLSGE
jgi:hypothetical protein